MNTLSKNQVIFLMLGALVLLIAFALWVTTFSHSAYNSLSIPALTSTGSTTQPVVSQESPYTFSTSSPLQIVRTTQHLGAPIGTMFTYTGTLPALSSCQSISVQTPISSTNPIHFELVLTTAPTTCTNPQKPLTFNLGFGPDSKGDAPVLTNVMVNGNNAVYNITSSN